MTPTLTDATAYQISNNHNVCCCSSSAASIFLSFNNHRCRFYSAPCPEWFYCTSCAEIPMVVVESKIRVADFAKWSYFVMHIW